jgi:hypothetical protein
MMTILSRGLAALVGPYVTTLTVPMLILGLLVATHQWVKARDEKIAVAAANICNKNWEAEIRTQERDAAQANAAAAQAILEGERRVNEGLRNELQKINDEIATVRAGSAGADARCLSDSVLRSIDAGGSDRRAGAQGRPK